MLKNIRAARRKIRTYAKCFGFLRGFTIALQESMTSHPKEISVSFPGVQYPINLRLNTSDLLTCVKIFFKREYEIELTEKPRIIVDAGANIGLASIFYANKYPEAMIIAVEPEQSNFSLLKKNVRSYANIIAVNKALWGENTTLDIVDPRLDKWGFQTHQRNNAVKDTSTMSIEGITMNRLMEESKINHIDILKIDIEGAEKEVFQSGDAWISKVGIIAIELHDRYKMGCSRSFYNATNGFELEIRKGENIFLVKRADMVAKLPLYTA
jgi:FkbM family methyltransferase